MVGQLTHLLVVMCPVLHFLGRLRHLMECDSHQHQVCALLEVCKDVRLFLCVLDIAAAGVILNHVTFCMLICVYRVEAYSAGL